MKLIPILASLVIIIGCLMPWFQLGIFSINGIESPYGAFVFLSAVVSGGYAFADYSKRISKKTWIYPATGIIGMGCVFIIYYKLGFYKETSYQPPGIDLIPEIVVNNILGTGFYIVLSGSFCLLLYSFGFFKPDDNSVPVKKLNANRLSKIDTETYDKTPEEWESWRMLGKLNQLILDEQNRFMGGGMTSEISQLLGKFCASQEEAIYFLKTYQKRFGTDLIADLIKMTSSYKAIKINVSKFIELNLIEENYPHSFKPEFQNEMQTLK